MSAVSTKQAGFFEEELSDAYASVKDRDRALWDERERRLQERLAVILADTAAWKGGPFAERIDALLGLMVKAGDEAKGMHDAILNGINTAAKANRLDEKHVAFVEEKARQEVAKVGLKGAIIEAPWRERTTADLAAVAIGCVQLPEPIQAAALAKLNSVGPQLGKLGFADEREVDGRATAEARGLKDEISSVYSSLMLLSGQRYRVEMAYKNINPDKVEQFEDFATKSIGIDTRQYPGVKTDLALMADGKERTTEGMAKRVVRTKSEKLAAASQADTAAGFYVGRVLEVTDDEVLQKFGRHTDDLVRHDRSQLEGGAGIEAGEVVTIRYAMGVGEVLGMAQGRSEPGVDR